MARRYITIDFLRGIAIFLMVFLHTLMRWVNRDYFAETIAQQKFIIVFILVSAIFFGAWCGFFLLVSSIGNMISMRKGLERGMSSWTLGLRQVIGGLILLVFAWLSEGVIGYHGAFGEMAKYGLDPSMFGPALRNLFSKENNGTAVLAVIVAVFISGIVISIFLDKEKESKPLKKYGLSTVYAVVLSVVVISVFAVAEYGFPEVEVQVWNLLTEQYDTKYSYTWESAVRLMQQRGFESNETIHAVANCVIINGIVQAVLVKIFGNKKPKHMMITYAVLAGIILALTPLIWNVLYPFDPNGNGFGEAPVYEIWYNWFLHAFDGGPEPLFPFLAEAFLGSIIGIWMTQEKPNRKFLKIGLWISFVVFWLGLAGTMYYVATTSKAMDVLISDSWNINRFGNRGDNPDYHFGFMWLFWFLCLTAAHAASVLLIVRLIEFRGSGHAFAKGTRFMRRFGFVAFTIYNFQYFDQPVVWLFSLLPQWGPYNYGHQRLGAVTIWPVVFGFFIFLQGILYLWEKVDYVFSLEWFIAKISGILIPSKKDTDLKWWQTSRLNAQSTLIEVEPIHYIEADEVDHKNNVDSILAWKLAILGFIFFPLSIVSYVVLRTAKKTEEPNKKMKAATIMSTIGMSISVLVVIVSLFLSLSTFGINSI